MSDYNAPHVYPPSREAYDAETIAQAKKFVVVKFLGRRTAAKPDCFERYDCPSLEAARQKAAEVYVGRPLAIYAVLTTMRECHVENWEPNRNWQNPGPTWRKGK